MRNVEFMAFDRKCQSMHRVKSIDFTTMSVRCCGLKITDCDFFLGYNEFDLLQFTGLTDKNGAKIHEGDIVIYGSGVCNGVVEFSAPGETMQGSFCIRTRYGDEIKSTFSFNTAFHVCEVIGNIFQHPELLIK